ncbi:hypothetical protein P9112_004102 [Eukaryota sp. TZLM1-RC]
MGSCVTKPDKSTTSSIANTHARSFFQHFRLAVISITGTESSDVSCVKNQLALVSPKTTSFSISFSGRPLSFSTTSALFDSIKQIPCDFSLSFENCAINQDGGIIEQICHSLTGSSLITSLNLTENLLGPSHILSLSQCLSTNKSLSCLVLSLNPIGPSGFKSLSRSLFRNNTLIELRLARCSLTSAAVSDICALIKGNKKLEILDFSENLFDKKSVERLISSIKTNFSIKTCSLDGNDVSSSLSSTLSATITRNVVVNQIVSDLVESAHSRYVSLSDLKELESFAPVQLSSSTPSSNNWHSLSPLDTSPHQSLPSVVDSPAPSLPSWLQYRPLPNQVLNLGHSETIGRRNEMEDAVCIAKNLGGFKHVHYVGLFDGHGGSYASEYCSNHFHTVLFEHLKVSRPVMALKTTFVQVNSMVNKAGIEDGTTALILLVIGNRRFVANAGDSRAVLSRNSKAIRLSVDHKPTLTEEEERIRNLGGFVEEDRVLGTLAVSRAIGDSFLQPYVSCRPYVSVTEVLPEDSFLILACDGLWDVCTDEEAIKLIANDYDPNQAALRLRDYAFANGSSDNISIIVAKFS